MNPQTFTVADFKSAVYANSTTLAWAGSTKTFASILPHAAVSRLDCFQYRQAILRIRLPSHCPDVFTPVSRQYPYARTVPLSCRGYACHSVYSPAGPWWVSFNLAPREIVNHFRKVKEMVGRGWRNRTTINGVKVRCTIHYANPLCGLSPAMMRGKPTTGFSPRR